MKKFSIKSFIAGFSIAVIGTASVFAAGGIKSAYFNDNKVILDGKELNLGGQQMISVIKDGEQNMSNYMPVRGVLQAMGYTVDWDGQKNSVIVTSPGAAPQTPQPTTPPSGPKTVKVGVCIWNFDDYFMTLYRNEIEKYFQSKSNGEVRYDVTIVNGKGDQLVQKGQINTFIAQKVDVLIVNLVQSSAAAEVINLTKVANIPTVFINREPAPDDMQLWDKIAYVGEDRRQAGTYMGEIVRDLPRHGDINGDGVVSYVMLVGDPQNVDAQYRTQYSVKALTDAGIKVEKLVEASGYWDQVKGEEIMADALVQYGNKIDVVFANNDGMGLGALKAIEAAGRTVGKDIYLVSVDALPEVVDYINWGEYTGTVLNNTAGQAHTTVDVAIKAANGEKLEKNYVVDYVKIVAK